eukprot:Selendium_serpulae@DN1764_c0_g1_i1.p1
MFSDFSFGASQGSFFGGMGGASASQPAVSEPPAAQKKTRKSIASKLVEPGYVSVTVCMLQEAVKKGHLKSGSFSLHGQPCGVVKLVGYILETSQNGGLTEFQMTDGTGAVNVLAESNSENDKWFDKKLKIIKTAQLIRVVGTVHTSESAGVEIRAIHFTVPDAREYAYLHSIECCFSYLSLTKGGCNNTEVASGLAKLSLSPKEELTSESTVDLPQSFDEVVDPCERHALKYILDHRDESVGVSKASVKSALNNRFSDSAVETALESLMSQGAAYKSIDGFVDALAF